MGNYSQDPDIMLKASLNSGYFRVRFQQGKPVLDRELNLLADLTGGQSLAASYIGNGVPTGTPGFAIGGLNVAGGDFTIGAGRALVNGMEAVLAANTTYKTQPVKARVAALPAGASNVYLRVFSTEINATQDAALGNAGDVGFETAIRERVDWEVLVSIPAINAPDHLLLAVIDTGANTVTDRRRVNLNLGGAIDEITAARGTAAQLPDRLNASLAPNGTLKPAIVTNAQIASNSVSLDQMKRTVVFSGSLTIGPNVELPVNLISARRQAHLSVSVMIVSTSGAAVTAASVTWTNFFSQSLILQPPPAPPIVQVVRGIRIKNESTTLTLTVAVEAIEILPI